ncbi:MAG: substrate-binding domain-containing protein [Duncaniella sp.]|nr:substrate-binding domain-containing protein [Duncaniella sp.]
MNRFYLIIVLFLGTLFFTGCREQQVYRIGVSQCSEDDWRRKMNDEINREIMFHPEAVVEIRSADDSNEKQISDIRYFIDNDFDIIIAAPNEADAITPIIKEAYESGIPVLLFDRNINGNTYTAFQGVDNVAIGEAAAHYARHLAGEGAKILEIHGRRGSTPAHQRHDGFVKGVEKDGTLQLLATAYGNWNDSDAAAVVDSLIDIYPDVDLIYAHNDRMAIAASRQTRARGLRPYIIGIDAAPEIGIKAVADSVIDATFLYPTEGHRLIRTAHAILEHEPYDSLTRLPVSSPVDISNADILLLQNEALNEETARMKRLKSEVDDYWSKHSAQTTLLYASIIILILAFSVLFMLLRAYWQRKAYQLELERQNRELEHQRDVERDLNEQLNQATQSKLMFFTNVSHDLRTPLTLISAPVEQMLEDTGLTEQQHTLLRIADKNIRILRRLINQILDFRKYENGKLDINLSEVSLPALIREWSESFVSIARCRDIKLTIDVPDSDIYMAVDPGKMERVVFNLLGNALKYTPDNGRIAIRLSVSETEAVLKVSDTGQGISEEDLGHVFERFFQVDKVHPKGSGIGLSLVKAFVELHGGSIDVESRLGVGTEFTIVLPLKHVAASSTPAEVERNITAVDVEAELGRIECVGASEDVDSSRPLILVIDDNADIRRMLDQVLRDEYRMIFASNGREGVAMAAKYVPDLVICDVMMPVMDGLECCRLIKQEMSTSHVPVLMLTACSMDEQRVQGYDSGADGYVSKPFSINVLRSRCHSLIENRRRIRDLWHGFERPDKALKPDADRNLPADTHDSGTDVDSEFYNRFIGIVRAEMGNADLNVDMLASRMGLGRSQFYRKIKALTNYSPVELLRRLRLNAARDMLTTTECSISEIGYSVGFSTPAYFTKCYREAFGETPSDLRERLGK